MSRIGKLPVKIPAEASVELLPDTIVIKGKLGELSLPLVSQVKVSQEKLQDGEDQLDVVVVKPTNDSKEAKALWGTTRSNIANMVEGVTNGFTVTLEVRGVGYRASINGNLLKLTLGFSHDILIMIPEGITIKCEKQTRIIISGADKQRVGEVAAKIRKFRPPEPYKGKGVLYVQPDGQLEQIRRKEGKKK